MALDAGHGVVGVDNLNDYYDVRVKEHRLAPLIDNDAFRFYQTDIEDGDALDKIFSDHPFDAVVNLAARAGVRASIEDPHIYMRTNTVATLNLLERMVRHEVPKLVIASTSSLYAGQAMPFTEDANVTRPISPYAATKLAAESLCHVWHQLHSIDISVVRYFTVYGPAGRPDMAPFRFSEWIRRGQPITLYGDGSATRDFTFIDDIASGTLAALKPLGYEVINLGGGNNPVSVKAMIVALEEHLGKKAIIDQQPPFAADMQDTSAEIGKARKLLEWTSSIPPEEGFRLTADWHAENAEWLENLRL